MWVEVSISGRHLHIKPRRIASVVAWVSGFRGGTSVDWRSIDRVIDTGTAINGGLWFVLNDGTRFRLSFADALIRTIASELGCTVETADDPRAEEREQRKLMRAGNRFDW